MDMTQIAMGAMKLFSPQIAAQASEKMKKYPQTKEGLQQLISEYGGQNFIDSAVNFASTAPRVKAMFNRFGINPQALKNTVMQNIGNQPSVPIQTANPANSFQDRLNKLR